MNISAEDGEENLRYAEYVLGVLDAEARATVAAAIRSTTEAADAVDLWERRLVPLAEEIVEIAPPPRVWRQIRDALDLDGSARAQPRKGFWNNLPLWHWIGIGASVVAAACLVLLVTQPHLGPTSAPISAGYMVSAIEQDNGVTGWTATMDLPHAQIIVVPATPIALAQGRAPQLWLIPAGQKPISVGMITLDQPTTLTLDPALLARLGPTALLAVSVEPIGGSPTGQPTGPVIAKGAISGVPHPAAHSA
jgi:anti-sigma-K factor RskA